MLIPLYGFLKGDTIGLVVLVQHNDRVAEIARSLQQAAGCRVAPSPVAHVLHDGHLLDPNQTVAGAGLQPLDRVDVITETLQ